MIKAMIIDDEAHCIQTLAMLLKEYCPEVKVMKQCGEAEEGLATIEELKPDLVFLDIEMPGMNGFELLEKVTDIDFEIIFTTSYDQYAIKAIRFSALDYLLKPVDPEELQRAVNKGRAAKAKPVSQQFEILLQKLHQPVSPVQKIALQRWKVYR
jgi:two-component system LytT family response regulator